MSPAVFVPCALAMNGVSYAFVHTDILGQTLVVVLMLFSVLTWTIMLEKGIGLSKAKKASELFIATFREKRNPLALKDKAAADLSPVARVFESGVARLTQFYGPKADLSRRPRPLSEIELEVLRSTLEQTVSDQIIVLEEKMTFLSTAVSASPFLGLFGTVWGIMLAFTSLAQAGKADIQVLAPGVSGALLTTVLGLVVAIPSLIGYNVITILNKQLTVHMDNFVEEFVSKLKLEQLTPEDKGEV